MEIEIRQEFLADRLSCVAFKKYIVWQDYCCTSASFEHQHHMLKEVELVVLGFNIEVWTIDFNRTGRACAKWRVGKDDIH